MALKSIAIVCFLIFAIAEAQSGLLGSLLGLIRIQGIVYCSANGSATPVFPNATVQLQCGGNVISSIKTNESGVFSMLLDPLLYAVSSLLNNCNLKIDTPLSNCGANVPVAGGLLQSALKLTGTVLEGLLNVVNITPAGFQLVPLH